MQKDIENLVSTLFQESVDSTITREQVMALFDISYHTLIKARCDDDYIVHKGRCLYDYPSISRSINAYRRRMRERLVYGNKVTASIKNRKTSHLINTEFSNNRNLYIKPNGKINFSKLSRNTGVSRNTVRRHLKENS